MAYAVVGGARMRRLLFVNLIAGLLFLIIHYLRRTRCSSSSPDESVQVVRLQRFNVSWSQGTDCGSEPPGIGSLQNPQWQRLTDDVFVYSAFVTHKHPPNRTVEIIAVVEIANDTFLDNQACVCWFRLARSQHWLMSEIRVENEPWYDRHKTKYGDVRFICDIPSNTLTTSVTLQCQSRSSCASARLPVHQQPVKSPIRLTFALCSAVLYGSVSADRLIEFIEYYRIIGVGKFIFYKHDVSFDVQRVLDYYRMQGMLDVYAWTLPGLNMTNTSLDVWYFAQTAALNDCTERTGSLWDYTLIVDLDEFLVINHKKRLSDLVHNGSDDCVLIRSAVVRVPSPTIPGLHPTLSIMLKYSMRQSFIYPWYSRSKTVCRGRTVMAAGIHYPHYIVPGVRFEPANRTADPDTEAILFHMREERLDDEAKDWSWVSDERVLDYVERVSVSVDRVVRKLGL